MNAAAGAVYARPIAVNPADAPVAVNGVANAGVEVPAAAPVNQGIRGWLLVVTLLILVVFPVATLSVSFRAYGDARNVRNGLSGVSDALRKLGMENKMAGFGGMGEQMVAVALADLLLDLAMCAFAVYAGYGLLKRTPRAVMHARLFLAAVIVYAFVREIVIPNAMNVTIDGASGAVFWLWVLAAAGLGYFARSQRVRATYPLR